MAITSEELCDICLVGTRMDENLNVAGEKMAMEHCGITLELLWDRFGITLVLLCEYFATTLKQLRDICASLYYIL